MFNLVIAKRELGKSFGMREQTLRDYRDNGERCIAIVRYKDDVQLAISDFYGDVIDKTTDAKLARWLKRMEFRTQGNSVYVREKQTDGEKHQWDEIMRMIPLSKATRYKMATMRNLRRVMFDEALIDKSIDTYTRYLPNEYKLFQNLIGTLQRYCEKDAQGAPRLRAYLMGNAVDLINPYFAALGIYEQPDFGYRWFMNKTWFFAYPNPEDYSTKSSNAMMAERLGENSSDYGNAFAKSDSLLIKQKTKNATFSYGICYKNETFGVWCDFKNGYYFVNHKIPKDTGDRPMFSLTAEDNRPNYIVAKRANSYLKSISDLYCFGCVMFDTPATRENFVNVLKLFGVR